MNLVFSCSTRNNRSPQTSHAVGTGTAPAINSEAAGSPRWSQLLRAKLSGRPRPIHRASISPVSRRELPPRSSLLRIPRRQEKLNLRLEAADPDYNTDKICYQE